MELRWPSPPVLEQVTQALEEDYGCLWQKRTRIVLPQVELVIS